MSLINQMLQDLASRQAPMTDALNQITPVSAPVRRNKALVWVVLGIAALLGANVLAWLWWQSHASKPATTLPLIVYRATAAIPLPAAKPAAPVMALTGPLRPAPVIPALNPVPVTAPAVDVAPSASPKPGSPRPATMTFPPAPLTVTETTLEPIQTSISPALNKSSSILTTTQPEPVPATPASISKRVKPLTNPQLAENEYRKALADAQLGKANEAMAGFSQALQFDPAHHAARLTLVGLLIEKKRMGEAERVLQAGLALGVEQTDFAMILARLQVERGNVVDAIATLERSGPFAADQADYQAFLAALLQRVGRHQAAIAHYVIALKQSPQSGVWWMGLGISLKADNQPEKAREAFTRAKATNTLSPDLLTYVNQQMN